MIVRFPWNIHVSRSESQIKFLRGQGVNIRGKLALCATESGYMSHGSTKLSKVLTLSGLRAPIPLVRNIVAIIYAYGNFLNNIFANSKKIHKFEQQISKDMAKIKECYEVLINKKQKNENE